jgi:hypothetical protein
MRNRKLIGVLLGMTVLFLLVSYGISQTTGTIKPPLTKEGNPAADPGTEYKTVCGQCHMAYPPEFLPSASWEKLLASPGDHFGTPFDLDPAVKTRISQYLKEKGAEQSDNKFALKIMSSLDEQTPLRLTEVPYIQKKHRKITPEVLQRKAIGALNNCEACHRSAAKGVFNKNIVIPE